MSSITVPIQPCKRVWHKESSLASSGMQRASITKRATEQARRLSDAKSTLGPPWGGLTSTHHRCRRRGGVYPLSANLHMFATKFVFLKRGPTIHLGRIHELNNYNSLGSLKITCLGLENIWCMTCM